MTYENDSRYYRLLIEDAVSKATRPIRRLPSCTTILKEASNQALIPWASNMTIEGVVKLLTQGLIEPTAATVEGIKAALKEQKLGYRDARDDAGARGTITHDFVEELITFGPPETLPDDPWKAGLVKFWKERQPKVKLHEVPVACLEGGWAGRVDFLCTMVGRQGNTLVDLKTVKDASYFTRYPKAYDSNRVQLVVYREALMEENPSLDIRNLMVLRVADYTYDPFYVEPDTWQAAKDYFDGCMNIWKYRQLEKAV